MKQSVILGICAKYLFPLLLMFSLTTLFRGHNLPGGGFVGGLIAASAFVLLVMSVSLDGAIATLQPFTPRRMIIAGLLIAGMTGALPMILSFDIVPESIQEYCATPSHYGDGHADEYSSHEPVAEIESYSFMRGCWTNIKLPAIGTIGTPLFFDIGVYFVVLGVVLTMVFTLVDSDLKEEARDKEERRLQAKKRGR